MTFAFGAFDDEGFFVGWASFERKQIEGGFLLILFAFVSLTFAFACKKYEPNDSTQTN